MGFQLQQYSMAEDQGDQTVCLTVMSGMLAPGISVMANLATLTGNSMYYRQDVIAHTMEPLNKGHSDAVSWTCSVHVSQIK